MLLEGTSWDVLHHEVARTVTTGRLEVSIMKSYQVGVTEAGQEVDFGLPPQFVLVVAVLKDLDRDGAAELGVEPEVDGGHAAATDQLVDTVSVAEDAPEPSIVTTQIFDSSDRFDLRA